VFFQKRCNHSFAPKCPTSATKHDLDTAVLCLFGIFLLLFHFNQGFVAKLRCESCVQRRFYSSLLDFILTLPPFKKLLAIRPQMAPTVSVSTKQWQYFIQMNLTMFLPTFFRVWLVPWPKSGRQLLFLGRGVVHG
jgi:hypothetical protein